MTTTTTTTIREVRCFEVSGPAEIMPVEERQLQMLDVYPEFARRPAGGGAIRVTGTYVAPRPRGGTRTTRQSSSTRRQG